MTTPTPNEPDQPVKHRRYVRFLLRQGEQRGRLLAAVLPGVAYFVAGIYPLLIGGVHAAFSGHAMTANELTIPLVVAGMGLGGGGLTALILWRKSGHPQGPVLLWAMCLTMPLLIAIGVGSGLALPRVVDGVELEVHFCVVALLMIAGYFRLTAHGSLWPTHREFLHLYRSRPDVARDETSA